MAYYYYCCCFAAPPLVVIIYTEDMIYEGDNIVLTCEAVAFPLASIVWKFISPADHSLESLQQLSLEHEDMENYLVTSELTLTNATLSLRGNYHCLANNSLGIVEEYATVHIYGKSIIYVCLSQ